MYKDVRIMNIAYGKPAFPHGVVHWDKLNSQCRNIGDEHDELLVAINKRDRKEIRDAICDILVFALGACHMLDQDISAKVFFEKFVVREPSFPEDRVPGFVRGILVDYYRLLIAVADRSIPQVHEQLAEVISGTLALAQLIGMDIVSDMKMVFESNMSKFCATQGEVDQTVLKYEALGLEVYVDGEFPAKRVKSSTDQRDVHGESYPMDKMLKGVNYKKPVFA